MITITTMTHSITILSNETLCTMTFIIMTFSITTFSPTTHSLTIWKATFYNYTQHNNIQRKFSTVALSITTLSITIRNATLCITTHNIIDIQQNCNKHNGNLCWKNIITVMQLCWVLFWWLSWRSILFCEFSLETY
jgi:hypothetical protein